MMPRGRNPYECFKDDRHRLLALLSRDVRLVLIWIVAALTGSIPALRAIVAGWFA
jgi:hypothetical protein